MSTLAVLLKESWGYIEDRADDLANNFYARVFFADPSLRELFPVAMTDQRSRWVQALVSVIQTVDNPDALDEFMDRLGRSHRRFHVEPQHYGVVGVALLAALREYAGDRWSIEYDQAWRDAYDTMAIRMLTAAERSTRTPAFWHAEVVAHERRARDIAVITVRPLMTYPFRAGQYVHLEVAQHPREWRTYSIANAPRSDGTLEFHVRAPADGWVSSALVRRTEPGDMVRLGPAMGTMTLEFETDREVVLVAGGTGLAPILSIVRGAIAEGMDNDIHLYFGVCSERDIYGREWLAELQRRHAGLKVHVVVTAGSAPDCRSGLVTEAIARDWQHLEGFRAYLCGAPPMVEATSHLIRRMGMQPEQVYADAFYASGT